MKVRVLSKKKDGGEVISGLMDEVLAGSVLKLLERQYPDDKHIIIRSDKSRVQNAYKKVRVEK